MKFASHHICLYKTSSAFYRVSEIREIKFFPDEYLVFFAINDLDLRMSLLSLNMTNTHKIP